jgi:arsenate reductase
VNLAEHRSKHLDELAGVGLDWVVTVCDRAKESCPVFPGSVGRLHAGFDDPPRLTADETDEERILESYRRVRDEIRVFVVSLPERLAAA